MGSACRKPEAQVAPVHNGTTATTQRVRRSKEIANFCTLTTTSCSQQRICGVINLIKSVVNFCAVYRWQRSDWDYPLALRLATTARNFWHYPHTNILPSCSPYSNTILSLFRNNLLLSPRATRSSLLVTLVRLIGGYIVGAFSSSSRNPHIPVFFHHLLRSTDSKRILTRPFSCDSTFSLSARLVN